ncbi:MAG: hypothetical protein M1817_000358 [Caeruleum heppii]|nr:MAG: hypothetical protein M1817_000358 [Caeruleum heppii]
MGISDTIKVKSLIVSPFEAGAKLIFLDLAQEGEQVQGLCNLRRLSEAGTTLADFQDFSRVVRRGDVFSLTGIPHRTPRGELSILATDLPKLLSPSLHQLPTELIDPETRIRLRHTDLLVNPGAAERLRLRSHIIQNIRDFLLRRDFLEVATPVLGSSAGGAIARPFRTVASEFPEKALALRIAPELWLKRLILGGFDRVFEIGPSFRNEGLDANHNPEFTTCEFYKAFADIEDLISMTEELITGLAQRVQELKATRFQSLPALDVDCRVPFDRVDFIPAVEAALGRCLPDLSSPDAPSKLLEIYAESNIPVPPSPTLPRLLDRLSSLFIEPRCIRPTFIMQHPECLSPLAKSFPSETSQQRVSARVELFIRGSEIINAYEEENSPFEQRRKFEEQLKYRDEENEATVDESYLEALGWGLPPVGGWGCGIDRLVMLFTGTGRISDVLSFGSLRNVVGLARQAGSKVQHGDGTRKPSQ